MRKRDDQDFPNAAGIDIGASSRWLLLNSADAHAPRDEFKESRGTTVNGGGMGSVVALLLAFSSVMKKAG